MSRGLPHYILGELWASPLDISGGPFQLGRSSVKWMWYAKINLFLYFYLKLEVKDMLVKTASQDFPLLKWQRSIIILRVNEGTGRQAGPHAVSVSF